MNKFTIKILVLFLVAFSVCSKSFLEKKENNSREFLASFLKTIKGNEFILDSDCMGGQYDDLFEEINKAISKFDIVSVAFYINKIFNLELEKCPMKELSGILKDWQISFRNGNTFMNIMKHTYYIQEKMRDFVFNTEKNPSETGIFLGSMYTILVFGVPK